MLSFVSYKTNAQVPAGVSCDLQNYMGAYILNLNDYPYTSPITGITVTSTIVGPNPYTNFTYTCGGNTFNTATPAYWMNSAAQSWTLTFSVCAT